ncbi:sulfatase-like hydrolase/transferase [Silicimonas sp. MF1-12-2]|uniref:sulfatase-like hydrolase/transferase n=1 Tax=Silicimonas sp. MF1-12-2 TaxID=3384793 RepID=UPI0039B635A2
MPDKPNVLLIIVDQLRADLLDGRLAGIAGLRNMSALAEESCTFARHYTVAAPCGPSRVSLFTGQYAMNHRAVRNGTPLRHDTPNLAREMRAAGYDPLLFGYTDVTQDPRVLEPDDPRLLSYEELLPGFTEVVRMRQETDDTAWREHLTGRGYKVPDGMALYVPDGETVAAPALYKAEDSDTAFLTDRFLVRMEREPAGWFAALTYIRPHPPFVAPAPYNTMFDPLKVPQPVQSQDNAPHPFVEALQRTKRASSTVEGFPNLDESEETIQQLRALYLGLAAEVDHHIGRVISWLKASGRWDDTILVVTSDHGEMLGDHGIWGKDTYHDAAFHVPLMIRVPGEVPGRITGMTESIDVSPTILELVGARVPDSMNGTSLLPAIKSGSGGRAVSFSEIDFGDPVSGTALQRELGLSAREANLAILRTETHKLVHFAGSLPQVLHDMTAAGELRDISESPESQAICLDLSRQMLCHRMVHPENTFSRTMVVDGGVKTGSA